MVKKVLFVYEYPDVAGIIKEGLRERETETEVRSREADAFQEEAREKNYRVFCLDTDGHPSVREDVVGAINQLRTANSTIPIVLLSASANELVELAGNNRVELYSLYNPEINSAVLYNKAIDRINHLANQ